jgi:hypothetical protein
MRCKFAYSLIAVAAVWSGATLTAKADLVQLAMGELKGLAINSRFTVLTLQAKGGSTTESGGVGFINGSFQEFGDAQQFPKSRTFSLADLNITNANQLGLLVLLSEPRGEKPAPSVTATNTGSVSNLANRITLNVYSSTGVLLEQHTLADDLALVAGSAHTGFVFGLTATQAAQLNATIAANPGAVLTVGATFANAQGGSEVIQAVQLAP